MNTQEKYLSMSAEEQNKQELNSTIEREEIKNSPFTVITIEGESFGVMGDYRLTENSKNKDKIKKELKEITWNRLIQVVMILSEIRDKTKTKETELV